MLPKVNHNLVLASEYCNLLPSPGPLTSREAVSLNFRYSLFVDALDGPEYASNEFFLGHNAALVKKNRIWAKHQTYILGVNALAAPVQPFNWCHPELLNDCSHIRNCAQSTPRTYFYRPANATFKRRSRLLVRSARFALTHMYSLKPLPNTITLFARKTAQRSHASQQNLFATLQKMHWLNAVRLKSPITTRLVSLQPSKYCKLAFKLALNPTIYADIMYHLDERTLINEEWAEQMRPNYMYYQQIVFRGRKKRNLQLLKNIWDAFDTPIHVEIDYSTLTVFYLNRKWATFGGWYGATLCTYWNFFHLYNWKFFF